jgi:hypothetical protein
MTDEDAATATAPPGVLRRSATGFAPERRSSSVVSAAPEAGLTVTRLAQAWAAVASRTTYLPMSGDEIERLPGWADR